MHLTTPGATGPGDDAHRAAPRLDDREFHAMLVGILPRLRVHALSLTRDRAEADDLVQDAVALALRSSGKFEPGTSFSARPRTGSCS